MPPRLPKRPTATMRRTSAYFDLHNAVEAYRDGRIDHLRLARFVHAAEQEGVKQSAIDRALEGSGYK